MEDLIYIPTTRFVYFDEFGSLLSISNSEGENGKSIVINLSLMFSVTGYNEVQSLERVLIIELSKLISNDYVKIPFTSQIELSDSALSVYTIKRLESYHHKVIND